MGPSDALAAAAVQERDALRGLNLDFPASGKKLSLNWVWRVRQAQLSSTQLTYSRFQIGVNRRCLCTLDPDQENSPIQSWTVSQEEASGSTPTSDVESNRTGQRSDACLVGNELFVETFSMAISLFMLLTAFDSKRLLENRAVSVDV